MEGLGDGSASNGSRSSTVSNAGIEDAFAGAILPAGEEVHPGSVSTIHNNGRQQVSMVAPCASYGGALSIHGMPDNTVWKNEYMGVSV
uniref:Uncharacterized protein n=1 Tax=Aegilops tauschii TaxID=37682 RepID=M8BAZ5_AEGTA